MLICIYFFSIDENVLKPLQCGGEPTKRVHNTSDYCPGHTITAKQVHNPVTFEKAYLILFWISTSSLLLLKAHKSIQQG